MPSPLQTLLHQASTRKLKKDRKKEIRQLEDKVCGCVSCRCSVGRLHTPMLIASFPGCVGGEKALSFLPLGLGTRLLPFARSHTRTHLHILPYAPYTPLCSIYTPMLHILPYAPYTPLCSIPYSGKFSYGANFRIFRMKPRDTKIKTTKILTVEILTSNFERAIEHVEAASKRWGFITVFLAFERPSRLQWTRLHPLASLLR